MKGELSVGLVGAGAMGGALLRGWIRDGVINAKASAVFDPAPAPEIASLIREAGLATNPPREPSDLDALVVAVKPQIANEALPAVAPLGADAVVISVMAGRSAASVRQALGGASKIVRAMPNLPAAIGAGVSGLYAEAALGSQERRVAERLMRAVGETVWVESEAALDLVTAVSGSGPAYYFLLTEALAEAGAALGLTRDAAEGLARATAAGAGALLAKDPRSAAELRGAVTSPGGTTAAALKVFDDGGLRVLVREAVAAAAKRAGDLTS